MIKLHDPECTGCTACFAVCPTDSIRMAPDDEGFLFPEIDPNTCINCNKCADVCPLNGQIKYDYDDYCYIATSANEDDLANCSSGGVFPLLARDTLSQGGLVCGCILDSDCVAKHVISEDPETIRAMSKSKYVQSDMGNCYRQTKGYLEAGRFVLFTGTPCQIGGLRSYLKKEYPNLMTMDFACHGVPSPLIFSEYVKQVKSQNPDVETFWFRNKSEGWYRSGSMTWINKNGEPIQRRQGLEDPYWKEFADCNTLRKSCPLCKFCTPQRSSDFTVGDHWNLGKSRFYHPMGVSFILCNNKRALKWLQMHEDEFQTLERISLKMVCQQHFWKPYFRGKKRGQTFRILKGKIDGSQG